MGSGSTGECRNLRAGNRAGLEIEETARDGGLPQELPFSIWIRNGRNVPIEVIEQPDDGKPGCRHDWRQTGFFRHHERGCRALAYIWVRSMYRRQTEGDDVASFLLERVHSLTESGGDDGVSTWLAIANRVRQLVTAPDRIHGLNQQVVASAFCGGLFCTFPLEPFSARTLSDTNGMSRAESPQTLLSVTPPVRCRIIPGCRTRSLSDFPSWGARTLQKEVNLAHSA